MAICSQISKVKGLGHWEVHKSISVNPQDHTFFGALNKASMIITIGAHIDNFLVTTQISSMRQRRASQAAASENAIIVVLEANISSSGGPFDFFIEEIMDVYQGVGFILFHNSPEHIESKLSDYLKVRHSNFITTIIKDQQKPYDGTSFDEALRNHPFFNTIPHDDSRLETELEGDDLKSARGLAYEMNVLAQLNQKFEEARLENNEYKKAYILQEIENTKIKIRALKPDTNI